MSDLTNELRDEANGALAFGEHVHAAMLNKAADRIDALEECLRESVYCLEHDVTVERSMNLLDKARALLGGDQ